jgi:hypothetical protein
MDTARSNAPPVHPRGITSRPFRSSNTDKDRLEDAPPVPPRSTTTASHGPHTIQPPSTRSDATRSTPPLHLRSDHRNVDGGERVNPNAHKFARKTKHSNQAETSDPSMASIFKGYKSSPPRDNDPNTFDEYPTTLSVFEEPGDPFDTHADFFDTDTSNNTSNVSAFVPTATTGTTPPSVRRSVKPSAGRRVPPPPPAPPPSVSVRAHETTSTVSVGRRAPPPPPSPPSLGPSHAQETAPTNSVAPPLLPRAHGSLAVAHKSVDGNANTTNRAVAGGAGQHSARLSTSAVAPTEIVTVGRGGGGGGGGATRGKVLGQRYRAEYLGSVQTPVPFPAGGEKLSPELFR